MSKRIRPHINPFNVRAPCTESDWVPENITQFSKIHIDMGCYKGEFILELARKHPDEFFIGIEIRNKVFDEYLSKIENERIKNLKYLLGNITISLNEMFVSRKIDFVYINFPDPYSKKEKLKKRRMINSKIISDLFDVMNFEGKVFVQTDNESLAKDMLELFLNSKFTQLFSETNLDRLENKIGIRTSWETACIEQKKTIYRFIFQKTTS